MTEQLRAHQRKMDALKQERDEEKAAAAKKAMTALPPRYAKDIQAMRKRIGEIDQRLKVSRMDLDPKDRRRLEDEARGLEEKIAELKATYSSDRAEMAAEAKRQTEARARSRED